MLNPAIEPAFPHRHLLGIEGLSRETSALLDLAEAAVEVSRQVEKKRTTLRGRSPDQSVLRALDPDAIVLRARRQAARRRRHEHGGRNLSVKKGETLIDTAMTLNAMRPDIIVVRHHSGRRRASARAKGRLLGRQRRRRRARASDPGAARRADHPPQQGPHRGAGRGDLRRHPAFARGALQHHPALRRSARGCGSSGPRR